MKFTSLLTVTVLCATLGSALAADENDNLAGAALCIDNNSFTADIGSLGATSKVVSQALYDYFASRVAAKHIKVDELGKGQCTDYWVGLDFGATEGTPRAWYGEISLWDYSAYASTNASSKYKQPVSVWNSSYYGALENSRGLADYLIDQGKGIIDEFLVAYAKVN